MEFPVEIKYYGNKDKLPQQRFLSAGDLSVVYESGNLRYIACNNNEIIRMIYAAVRDKNWLTATPEITDEIIEDNSGSFHISYNCRYRLNDIDFSATFQIIGSASGSITFEMKGKALSTFLKNRIGFCILHPVKGCAGVNCRIVHSDTSTEIKPFPIYIDPENPFRDVRSMTWNIRGGMQVTISFQGDIFETEDQRNWTDASFKTYCTPLENPFPVLIEQGTLINQKIELVISGNAPSFINQTSNTDIILNPIEAKPMPSLGIGRSTRDFKISESDAVVLSNLNLGQYRTDLYLFSDWKEVYLTASAESNHFKWPLELALYFGDEPEKEVKSFFSLFHEVNSSIKSVFLFHKEIKTTTKKLVTALIWMIRENIPKTEIYVGTNCNFAQINRSRPDSSLVDGIVFAIHPQEHAFDTLTLVENLQAQAYAVESAKQFANGKKIAVSPVTFQRRFNANIENYESHFSGNKIPSQIDQRQVSLFGAAWTAVSFKYLAQAGVSSVSYYETTGERGVIMGESSSRWPSLFFADRNTLFPMYHVLAFIAQFQNAEILGSISSNPLKVDSLVIKDKNYLNIILTNLTHLPQSANLPELLKPVEMLNLDENSFNDANKKFNWLTVSKWDKVSPFPEGLELILMPYGCVFIKTSV
jgi:D-apionolactonase